MMEGMMGGGAAAMPHSEPSGVAVHPYMEPHVEPYVHPEPYPEPEPEAASTLVPTA